MKRLVVRLVCALTLACAGGGLLALGVGRLLNEDDLAYAAFINSASDIYQMSPSRHISIAITHNQTVNNSPAWSPDGQQIAFISKYGDKYLVSIMDAYNGRGHPVTDATGNEYSPVWSPDGRYIAFLRLNDTTTDLFVTDLKLGNTRHLNKIAHTYYAPAWSPDGRYITFAADINSRSSTDLFKLDIQTDLISPLVETPAQETFNTWSPDGHYLLYMTKATMSSVYLWDMQAGQSILIFQSSGLSSIPNWSSDSRSIVFSAFTKSGQNGLFQLDITGCVHTSDTCEPQLLTSAFINFLGPRWRPRSS